jgi:glutamate dehydrogenase
VAPADLFYNGGIGTYVKASTRADADIGDRANDAMRVNGRELRCKVVGEGGNLGITQRGRIEFALHGDPASTPTPSTTRPVSTAPTTRSTSRSS